MSSVAIITSAAYAAEEICALYGELPPAFLPFGSGRLYQKQVAILKKYYDRVIITIPDNFEPTSQDLSWLEQESVNIIKLTPLLTLSRSLASALDAIIGVTNICVLHGDTLVSSIPSNIKNCIGVVNGIPGYRWGDVSDISKIENDSRVLAGWFAFHDVSALKRALTENENDFEQAILKYSAEIPCSLFDLSEWLDFGHLRTFLHSRSTYDSSRSFNEVQAANNIVTKKSINKLKIRNEADWYTNIPEKLRIFTPQFLGRTDESYRIAYEHSPTLQELYLYGRLSRDSWDQIAMATTQFLRICESQRDTATKKVSIDDLRYLYFQKLNSRLCQWLKNTDINPNAAIYINGVELPPLTKIVDHLSKNIFGIDPVYSIMHGDLCFSNIFFNSSQMIIKVIDPRGSINDCSPSIYGDLRYDLAKINHSLEGYDSILANRFSDTKCRQQKLCFTLLEDDKEHFAFDSFDKYTISAFNIPKIQINSITVGLFLSMLPLHSDKPNRQLAMFANALRIYEEKVI